MNFLTQALCLVLVLVPVSTQTWRKTSERNSSLGAFIGDSEGHIKQYHNNKYSLSLLFCGQIKQSLKRCIQFKILSQKLTSTFGQISPLTTKIQCNLLTYSAIDDKIMHKQDYESNLEVELQVRNSSYLTIKSSQDRFNFDLLSTYKGKVKQESLEGSDFASLENLLLFQTAYAIIIYFAACLFQNIQLNKTTTLIITISTCISVSHFLKQAKRQIGHQVVIIVLMMVKSFSVLAYLFVKASPDHTQTHKYQGLSISASSHSAHSSSKQSQWKQIPKLYLSIISCLIFQNQILNILILAIYTYTDVMRFLQNKKISQTERQFNQYHILGMIFLPLAKILGLKGAETLGEQVYLLFFVWIIMAALYEISNRYQLAIMLRKCKWSVINFFRSNLESRFGLVCMICYKQDDQLAKEGKCQHTQHSLCAKCCKELKRA